jgi:hypothetical protein
MNFVKIKYFSIVTITIIAILVCFLFFILFRLDFEKLNDHKLETDNRLSSTLTSDLNGSIVNVKQIWILFVPKTNLIFGKAFQSNTIS